MRLKTFGVLVLCTTSMQAVADKEYWLGTDGEYVRDRNGHCVRTIKWTSAAAIPGCEDRDEQVTDAPAKTLPVEEPVVAESKGGADTASASEAFSLSSGATFELGGSTLSAEGKAEIAALMAKFKGKTADSVVIEGHTDDSGDASFNQHLSEKRAEAVKAEAVAQGADSDKITTVGHGESKPIADNSTPDGRAKNRRVEIKVDGVKDKI